MRTYSIAILTAAFGALWASAKAADIQVPGDQLTIQAAVDAAEDGDTVVLADGTYTGPGNIAVNLAGKNITIRSSSGNRDACIVDGAGFLVFQAANSTFYSINIQNLTIRNGAAVLGNGMHPGGRSGGAIYLQGGWLTLTNCVLRDNSATGLPRTMLDTGGPARGGAIYAFGDSLAPSIVQADGCLFESNSATGGLDAVGSLVGDAAGGAIFVDNGTGAAGCILTGCDFIGNSSEGGAYGVGQFGDSWGGAVVVENGASVQAVDCVFRQNTSARGGAVYTAGSPGGGTIDSFQQCEFTANQALAGDGGALLLNNTHVELLSCTIAGNSATGTGGGVQANTADDLFGSQASFVRNTILYANGATPLSITGPFLVEVAYSVVQGAGSGGAFALAGATNGGSNIDANPMFVSTPSPGNPGNPRLTPSSPCIDAGNDGFVFWSTDLDGNSRIEDDAVDIGAYEFFADPLTLTIQLRSDVNALVSSNQLNPVLGSLLRATLNAAINNIQNNRPNRAILNLREFQLLVVFYNMLGFLSTPNAQALYGSAEEIILLLQNP